MPFFSVGESLPEQYEYTNCVWKDYWMVLKCSVWQERILYTYIYICTYFVFLGVPLIITVVTAGAANDFLGPKTDDDPQL